MDEVSDVRTLTGWKSATVTGVTLDGTLRVDFGDAGYLIIFTPFTVDRGRSRTTVDPLDESGPTRSELLALEGKVVGTASIDDSGRLSLEIGPATITVMTDEKAEAFQLSVVGGPSLLVSGMGGEIFEWA